MLWIMLPPISSAPACSPAAATVAAVDAHRLYRSGCGPVVDHHPDSREVVPPTLRWCDTSPPAVASAAAAAATGVAVRPACPPPPLPFYPPPLLLVSLLLSFLFLLFHFSHYTGASCTSTKRVGRAPCRALIPPSGGGSSGEIGCGYGSAVTGGGFVGDGSSGAESSSFPSPSGYFLSVPLPFPFSTFGLPFRDV